MKPIQKPNPKPAKPATTAKQVRLTVVSDKERQSARISGYAYILP